MARFMRGQAAMESPSATARPLRAQAAMEYLVTYGWALLALFAVVAILISTGAFSSSNFSQQECTFQPDLPCSPFILYLDGGVTNIKYQLTNGLGFPIKIVGVSYITNGIGQQGRYSWPDTTITEQNSPLFNSGDSFELNFNFPGDVQPAPRDFETIIVTIEYLNCKGFTSAADCTSDKAAKYTTSGRISSIVEPSATLPGG